MENNQPETQPQTDDFHFQENDSAGTRVLITAFIDSYNAFHNLVHHTNLDLVLSDLNVRTQALREIGECDDTFVELVKDKLRAVDQANADLGRALMLAIQFMNQKRGAEVSAEQVAEEWPDVLHGGDGEN